MGETTTPYPLAKGYYGLTEGAGFENPAERIRLTDEHSIFLQKAYCKLNAETPVT